MLKNFGYDGAYNDKHISVNVLLENPLTHDLEASKLVFSVAVKGKNGEPPRLDDFTFYIMDEANRLHNTQIAPYSKIIEADPDDDEPVRQPDGLILTDFKSDFLFQDLRIGFYYQPYQTISIIQLSH